MAYEDIYEGLTDEEKEKMIKADIPKVVTTGAVELSEEEQKEAHETLTKFIRLHQKAVREQREIPLTKEELNKIEGGGI